jgi:hypothetical protein
MNRKPMHQNEIARLVGMFATCNACDRIIYEDENDLKAYKEDGRGYCKHCRAEADIPLIENAVYIDTMEDEGRNELTYQYVTFTGDMGEEYPFLFETSNGYDIYLSFEDLKHLKKK